MSCQCYCISLARRARSLYVRSACLLTKHVQLVHSNLHVCYNPLQYGGRYTLAAGLTAWSVFTLLTPAAAALGSAPLLAVRVALGLGEGFAFPSIHAMISEYVPAQRQATVVGAVTAASYGGAALAFGASPTLAQNYG
jgi:MFS family permease